MRSTFPDALEAVVGAAVGQRHEMRHQVAAHFLRIDEVGHAEFLCERLARGIDVDADDPVRARESRTLHHVETDAAETEYDHVRAWLDLCSVDHRADARRHPATDVADLSKGASSRIFASAISGSTVWFEKVEQPM
jgi:hypothetical protein